MRIIVCLILCVTGCSAERTPLTPEDVSSVDIIEMSPTDILSDCERLTGISWPPGISAVDLYDNQQFYLLGHLVLPEDAVPTFQSKYSFARMDGQPDIDWALRNLLPENRVLPEDLLSASGDTNEQVGWILFLEVTTGRVWVFVNYADWGET